MLPDLSSTLLATAPTQDLPASQWLPAMLMSVGIVIMLVLWSISIRGRSSRKRAEFATPREQIDRIKAGHRTREVDQAQAAEIVTSVTELATRLENKAERLEQLIEQADARIAQLTLASEAKQPSQSAIAPLADSDPLHRSVCDLADAGHSPVEIAQQLDEQVGKVELILALRSK